MEGGLVITRKPGQDFTIGEDIRVTVLYVRGQQARIHIVAPDDKLILRGELEKKEVVE